MNRKLTALALTGAFLAAPMVASADDDARMKVLEERLMALEDKLESSEATIQAQDKLLRQHSVPSVSDGGGLDKFLSGLEVGGHVTSSYVYNFNNPDSSGANTTQANYQFNQRHNTFTLDAVKLEVGKPTTGPGTAGFQFDLLFGENASLITGTSGGTTNENDVYLQEAYVAYNYEGVDLIFGKFETLLGAELIDSPYNANVTQGFLFFGAIPLVHTGILASGNLSEEVGWAFGLTNGFNNFNDNNEAKGALAQLSFEQGPLFASVQGYYGADTSSGTNTGSTGPTSSDEQFIIDVVGTFQAADNLGFWVNLDYGRQEDAATGTGARDSVWWGASVGTRYDVNDKMYLAVRGEYFADEEGVRFFGGTDDGELKSLTGTLGYQLTSNLLARAELRWDEIEGERNIGDILSNGTTATGDDQDSEVFGVFEVSYTFD
jgi:hypothetical protein